jgi:hypothetical protein
MKRIAVILISSVFVISCSKESTVTESLISNSQQATKSLVLEEISSAVNSTAITGYSLYTIYKGSQFCTPRPLKSIKTSEMKFYAYFDNSAIYNLNNADQYDINKLWGFSEGFNNQYNSCRIGWAYHDGTFDGTNEIALSKLRLFAYSYAKGKVYWKEITSVPINTDIYCSIKLSGSQYTCSVNVNGVTTSVTVPRGTTASTASGYQQYPYFGGNQVAPQDIFIRIKPM